MSLYTQTSKMVNKCHNIIPSVLSLSSLPCYPSFFFHPSSLSFLSPIFSLPSFSFLLKHWHHCHLLPLSLGILGQQATVLSLWTMLQTPGWHLIRLSLTSADLATDPVHSGTTCLQVWPFTDFWEMNSELLEYSPDPNISAYWVLGPHGTSVVW